MAERTTAADLHRLFAKGEAEGTRIEAGGALTFRATSTTYPGAHYYIDLAPGGGHGCDCQGYARFRRCKHYAHAIAAAWGLPELEEEPAAAPDPAPAPAPARTAPTFEQERASFAKLCERLRDRDLAAALTRARRQAAAAARGGADLAPTLQTSRAAMTAIEAEQRRRAAARAAARNAPAEAEARALAAATA